VVHLARILQINFYWSVTQTTIIVHELTLNIVKILINYWSWNNELTLTEESHKSNVSPHISFWIVKWCNCTKFCCFRRAVTSYNIRTSISVTLNSNYRYYIIQLIKTIFQAIKFKYPLAHYYLAPFFLWMTIDRPITEWGATSSMLVSL